MSEDSRDDSKEFSSEDEHEIRRPHSLTRRIHKEYNRQKEKIRQSIGAVDQTDDRSFNRVCEKMKRHQIGLLKFHKHLVRYQTQLIETCIQNDKVMEALWKMVNPIWEESEEVNHTLDMVVHSWRRYVESLKVNIINPLEDYISELDTLSTKVAKRNRKLLDYDSSRHYLEDLKEATNPDHAKIQKQMKKVEENYKQYEALNGMLIPEINDRCGYQSKRVAELLINFYTQEQKFHGTVAQLFEELNTIMPGLHVRTVPSDNLKAIKSPLVDDAEESQFKIFSDETETESKLPTIPV